MSFLAIPWAGKFVNDAGECRQKRTKDILYREDPSAFEQENKDMALDGSESRNMPYTGTLGAMQNQMASSISHLGLTAILVKSKRRDKTF